MAKAKEYIGMWVKNDKNGNAYLSGSTEKAVFYVFKDNKDALKKVLYTKEAGVEGAKLKKLGELSVGTNDNGEFHHINNMFIFKNMRREKESHPDFNLVVYEEEDAV